MNSSAGTRNWRSMLGVVAAGVVACSLQVQGAPPGYGSNQENGAPPLKRTVRMMPPVQAYSVDTVIQREGLGAIPLSLELEGTGYSASTKTGGTCRANSDCDDCDFCTADVCTVTPPAIVGKCTNALNSTCSSCPDGDFCNGPEICDAAGVCRNATPGLPCTIPGQTCDPEGGPQRIGECADACLVDADCDDGLACTGDEICINPGPNGLCRAINIPCGPSIACREDFCDGGADLGNPCNTDADCAIGGSCTTTQAITYECFVNGRCCTDDTVAGDFLDCTRSNKPDCDANNGVWLIAGDDPGTPGDQANCTDPITDPNAPNNGETFNCPAYANNIFTGVDIDALTRVGQIGAASCNDFTEVGDDFRLAIPPGSYLEVTTVRMIKGFQQDGIPGSASRVLISFYDQDGNFIGDTITNGEGQGALGIRTYIYAEKLKIPRIGFITVKAAVRFSPFGKHTLVGGGSADTTGFNDPALMWMNGGPVPAADVWNAIGVDPLTPGRLAFEIVGNIIDDPSGACCDATSGNCDLVLPWKCGVSRCSHDQNVLCESDAFCDGLSAGATCLVPGFFQGAEAQCQACQNDEFRSCTITGPGSPDCPACSGVPGICIDDPGNAPCNADLDCVPVGGGPCVPLACDPDSDCPGGVCGGVICVGGTNDGNACDPDIDCSGGVCDGFAACNPVPPACTLEACCPDIPDGTCVQIGAGDSCPTGYTSRGNGTNCDPNLCEQTVSGYDTCVEAALPGNVHFFDVASMSGTQTDTWTITGDNLAATFNDNPGTCEFGIFDQNGARKDRGWWHAFTINACANVRMDFCGTEELFGEPQKPAWANLYNTCDPCTTVVGTSVVGGIKEGGNVGTADSTGDRGAPFCQGDDLWETSGPLPAGTYWYPVFSSPEGKFGPYQLHFTVSACARAACCLPEGMCTNVDDALVFDGTGGVITCADDTGCSTLLACDNDLDKACTTDTDCPACIGDPATDDLPCTTDADCGAGTCTNTSTCRAATCKLCARVNSFDCTTADGKWNGFGSTRVQCPGGTCTAGVCVGGVDDGFACFENAGDPITSCDNDPCEVGSCCTGPAQCVDRATPDVPCDLSNAANTCVLRGDCAGDFKGGAGCLDPIQPCPACTSIDADNCQFPLNGGFVMMSDLDLGANGTAIADDFTPLGDTITSVCVWGTYIDPTAPGIPGGASEEYSCVGTPQGETFRVRIFRNLDDGVPGRSGIPDTSPAGLVGESLVTGTTNIVRGELANTAFDTGFYGIPMQEYTLTLNTPITGMDAGTTYWIEVVDYTPLPDGNQCRWHWAQVNPAAGGEDGYVMAGISPHDGDPDNLSARKSVYVDGSGKGGFNMAFCLATTGGAPLNFSTPDDPIGCCWDCVTGGTPQTLMDCIRIPGVWDRTDPACAKLDPPPQPNDFCEPEAPAGAKAALLACGDGTVDVGEQCDDGNTLPNDGCDANCQLECVTDSGGGGNGASRITDGLYPLDNACANVDGPTLVRGEGGDTALDGDIWYEYTSTCTGTLTIDMCSTQTGRNVDGYTAMDSMLGVYHEFVNRCDGGDNDGVLCTCPGTPPRQKCIDATQCPGTICVGPDNPPGCNVTLCSVPPDPSDPLDCVEALGICRNQCPCPGGFQGVSPFQVGTGSDEGCNGIADAGAGIQQLTAFPEECYMIRVGAWMPAGAAPGTGNRGRGLMSVACEAVDCFPSSTAVAVQGQNGQGNPVDAMYPRMLAVSAGDAGRNQAIRVTWGAPMPPGWESWEGQSLFAGEPWCGSENGGVSFYDPIPCPAVPGSTLQLSELQCDPYFTDWTLVGEVNLIHKALVPSKLLTAAGPVDPNATAFYSIDVVDEDCALGLASSYGPEIVIRTSGWADSIGPGPGGTIAVSEDVVNVFDTLNMQAKFTGQPGAPSKAAMELLGVTTGPEPRLDGKTTVNDLVGTLGGFQGQNFPFTAAGVPPFTQLPPIVPPGDCPPP